MCLWFDQLRTELVKLSREQAGGEPQKMAHEDYLPHLYLCGSGPTDYLFYTPGALNLSPQGSFPAPPPPTSQHACPALCCSQVSQAPGSLTLGRDLELPVKSCPDSVALRLSRKARCSGESRLTLSYTGSLAPMP